jgi:hypothetical protein
MQPLQRIIWDRPRYGRPLIQRYALWMCWYLLAVWLLWMLGVEAIYQHPTPFYGFYFPAVKQFSQLAAVIAVGWLAYLIPALFLYPRSRKPLYAVTRLGVFTVLCGVTVYFFVLEAGRLSDGLVEFVPQFWAALRWQLLPLAVFMTFLAIWWQSVRRGGGLLDAYSARRTNYFLLGCIAFSIVFAATVAMMDGGPAGIYNAYRRHGFEYVTDIGVGGSIKGLFTQYNEMHPYLSMHSKVHPPGPVALLWAMSFVAGRSPEALSIATIIGGSFALVPLYFWVRDMTDEFVARTFALMYLVVPSITLFTATSADILFMPFTAAALFCFWRALHGNGVRAVAYGVGGGVAYALMSLLSFNLLTVGAFFGVVGLWRLADASRRFAVVQTAVVMLAAFFGLHVLVRLWSGFDMIECFQLAFAQFSTDQMHLEGLTPRWSSWAWRVGNPMCWLYFFGIPVSVLFFWRLRYSKAGSRALMRCLCLTVLVLSLLYLARGEGERSAMYIVPFAVVPAAHLLHELGAATRSYRPLLATVAFLAFQCWFTEAFFYTYW